MAFIQQTIPPPNETLTFTLKSFAGGLNNTSNLLEPNQCSSVKDMAFTDDTVMEKRKGTKYYDDFKASEPIVFMDEFRPYNDTDRVIRATEKKMYVDGEELRTLNGRINGVNFSGKFFFCDGEKIYMYGKFPQASTTYEKVVGTATDTYITMELTNPPEDYAPLGTEHTRGVVKYDYTNKKVWYEPCENEKTDSYKGANVIPEKARYLCVHGGRLFISGNDKDNDNVFISDVRNPYYYPVALPMQLPPNSDKVVGLAVFDNSVVVGRHDDIHVITGSTNNPELGLTPFELKRLNTHTGFANQESVSLAHNYLFFLGSDGNAYSLSNVRNGERYLSTSIISRTLDLFKEPISVTRDEIQNATAYFYQDQWYVSIGEIVLVYHYRHMAWTLYRGWNARSFYNLNDTLVFGNDEGRVITPSDDYLDLGKPYRAFWTSKYFDMDDANRFKQFREFFIVAHTFNEVKSDVELRFDIDYAEVRDSVTVQNEISIWGRTRWGDRFINRNINHSAPFTIGQRGRMIRFTFSNGYDPFGEVDTVDDLIAVENKRDYLLYWVKEEERYYVFYELEWHRLEQHEIDQAMRVYQVNGDYEMRGKR